MYNHALRSFRNARRGIIFDTNILLVFLVGLLDRSSISSFKRTASYSEEDFEILARIASAFPRLTTTPHVLTEVCNHGDSYNNASRNIYPTIIHFIENTKERRTDAKTAITFAHFPVLGIADTTLFHASLNGHCVVTDDMTCHNFIEDAGGLSLNFNHLRSAKWLAGT
jgi:hypothetical protein